VIIGKRRLAVLGGASAAALLMGMGAAATAAPSGAGTAPPRPYVTTCQSCHKADGSGTPGVFPRLEGRVGPAARTADGRKWLIATILFGQSGPITVDGKTIRGAMPPFARMSDSDVAQTLTWLAGRGPRAFTPAEVAAVRSQSGMTAARVGQMRGAAGVPAQ